MTIEENIVADIYEQSWYVNRRYFHKFGLKPLSLSLFNNKWVIFACHDLTEKMTISLLSKEMLFKIVLLTRYKVINNLPTLPFPSKNG